MTNQKHPITPPPKLVAQWDGHGKSLSEAAQILATQAARWGADQELEACCEWLRGAAPAWERQLRATRRPAPKPPETIKVEGFTYRLVQ